MSTAVAVLLVLVAMVSIQSGAAVAKGLFPVLGPAGTTGLRLVFSAAVLMLVLRPWRTPPSRDGWKALAVYGLSLGGMNYLFYMALARIPLGVAVALEFSGPLAVALAASRRPRDFAWVGMAVAGLALLLPVGEVRAGVDPWGAGYALGAGACWGLYIVFGKQAGGAVPGGGAAAFGMAFAALFVAPVALPQLGAGWTAPGTLALAAAVGVLSSALPYSLEMIALRTLPTQAFGILMSVEPGIAALSGWLFLAEALTPLQLVAIGLVSVASAGAAFLNRKSE